MDENKNYQTPVPDNTTDQCVKCDAGACSGGCCSDDIGRCNLTSTNWLEDVPDNDYEIVDMLGKPYQAGMKAAVTFVTDDTLEPGQQIISRIIKPQVNYKQVMIQAAQIEVSQAE